MINRQSLPIQVKELRKPPRLRNYTPMMWEPANVQELKNQQEEIKQQEAQPEEVKSKSCVIL